MRKKERKYRTFKLRNECLICKKKIEPSIKNTCVYCGGSFCVNHFNTFQHDCQGDYKGKVHPNGARPTVSSLKFI